MSQHLRRLLAGLMPAGLLGLSGALAQPAQAAVQPSLARPPEASAADVSARLAAVRAAVTDTLAAGDAEPESGVQAGVQKVWWGNHGWGRPWRWGWGNGGWRNGGWGNGGWGNFHPWGNGGWGNWHR